jgi:hypothetical protein
MKISMSFYQIKVNNHGTQYENGDTIEWTMG